MLNDQPFEAGAATCIRRLRLKVKTKAQAWRNCAAAEVNRVWNFCNETRAKVARPFAGAQLRNHGAKPIKAHARTSITVRSRAASIGLNDSSGTLPLARNPGSRMSAVWRSMREGAIRTCRGAKKRTGSESCQARPECPGLRGRKLGML
jgi:hypothetical protein